MRANLANGENYHHKLFKWPTLFAENLTKKFCISLCDSNNVKV